MSDTTATLVATDVVPTSIPTKATSKEAGFLRAVKDCASGTVGGVVQVLVGQPFDTVKVRLQTQPIPAAGEQPRYTGLLDCIRKTRQQEGFRAFYKGTTTPLIGIGACVSIQFVVLEHLKRIFAEHNSRGAVNGLPLLFSNSQLYLSGAMAGIANSLEITHVERTLGPVEHIRTRLQVQLKQPAHLQTSAPGLPFFKGPIHCFKYLYKHYGIRGIYKGQAITMTREFHGYGIYFLMYEYLMQREIVKEGKTRSELAGWKPCLFGAAAGYAMWISIYPIDVIKSKLQTDHLKTEYQQYKNAFDCAKKICVSEGVLGFFRGFGACMWRAGPVNAATFIAFELSMRVLDKL
ncbi:hypothetical protein G9A89_019589 [Geosiphon pyriformis]|nr:hypothetical protein G9A89_019589 [Geosiphon pyriformis]